LLKFLLLRLQQKSFMLIHVNCGEFGYTKGMKMIMIINGMHFIYIFTCITCHHLYITCISILSLLVLLFQHEPGIQKSTPQDHHSFASGLFQLHLDAGELLVDNLDHPFNFFRRNRPGTTLFPQQVHYVSSEFVTSLKQIKTKSGFTNH